MTDSSRHKTEISLLERTYTFACSAEEKDKLERAGRYLDRALQGIHSQGKIIDREKVTIMAALNLANELLELRDEKLAGEQSVNELSERLEKALVDAPQRS
ncbi:cell division protein ZapA [Halomonas huangheensis]|uniref:Cell division protein ZapA n=1 Tax=Halomonas huangheensis TaxID=1178482 RepID=W1N685_9GAMM|nr:cell division protein ZapA [Halomonas huangheensis]ALM50881.1 cell division protein ZapA [Halomonas huangheensis]ERL51019.1 hypothetical protein BJB45_20725 [Halomonas huangheensis]